ncbi:MAG: hypothetical protein VYE40_13755 [Myxococcota bacterium]|nr:hypothetical protein [Myxococcota bacterium]
MPPRMFADLHSHPTLYGFNRMRNTSAEGDAERFHPWSQHDEDLDHLKKGKRASAYSQADVAKLTASRCRLTFASITPIEKGFLLVTPQMKQNFTSEALKLATGATLVRSGAKFFRDGSADALYELSGILRNQGPVRQALQKGMMRYPLARIKHMQSPGFDYWDEFHKEYNFWKRKDGVRQEVDSTTAGRISGCYHMIDTEEKLHAVIEDDAAGELAMVMTIEGAHTFSIGPDDEPLADEIVLSRIKELKALPAPIFFLTLAHHFDNGICGHAHSIPDAGYVVLDQTRRMHEGLEKRDDFGARVVRELLALDENLEDNGERRILIDCKHMSARSRKEYYETIVRPANAKLAENEPALPVILSHAGYSGVSSLDAMIEDTGNEDDYWHIGAYYAWNLNFCDDDIRMVHETGGIFGVCLDQRVAGILPKQKVHDEQWIHVLMQQILGVVDVIMLDDRYSPQEKARIWDCVGLGTDYDGMIDPMSRYPTTLDLDLLAMDLHEALEAIAHTRMIQEIGVETLVEKICWKNAWELVRRHFKYACR